MAALRLNGFPIIASAIVLLVAIAAIVAVVLERQRKATLEHAKQSSAAMALALEQHIAWTLHAIDVSLGGVVDALRISPEMPKHHPPLRESMKRRIEELSPYIRAIFVIGADGSISHDTDYPKTPNVSLADRPYFRLHREDPTRVRTIAPPVLSRSGTGWFIPVARRVGFDQRFNGVAVAAVQPEHFEALYKRMGLGPSHAVSIYHRDGLLIARHPADPAAVGKSFAVMPLFEEHVAAAPAGSFIAQGGIFPYERVVSYRVLEKAPLVVAVTQDTASVLAAWRQTAFWAAGALLALALALAALIGQLVRRQRSRERAQRRLAQSEKLEALGLLTGGIAHDFANLLNVISVSLAVVTRGAERPVADEALRAAERAVSSGKGLIRRLLSFAKRQPLSVRPADLNAVVEELVPLLRQAAGSGIDLRLEKAPHLPAGLIDENAFEVALLNLVINAKDAMSGRGRIALTTYECTAEGDAARGAKGERCVCVAVEDDGPGMTEAVRQRVLEPFYTTKGERGTGLGLSQIYGFMRQISGDLRIDSAPGRGTVVRLIFPVAAQVPDPARDPVVPAVR